MRLTKTIATTLTCLLSALTVAETVDAVAADVSETKTRQLVDANDCRSLDKYECVVDAVWALTIDWVTAWADHDVDTYLAAYAPGVSPIDGLSYSAWRSQREQRVGDPRMIKLGVNFLDAELVADRKVRLLFIQRYSAESYSDIVLKTLVFQYINHQFKIVEEISHQTLSEADAQTIMDNIRQ